MSRRSLQRFIRADRAVFLVAEIAGQLVGDLLLLTRQGSSRARIYSVVVTPEARGLGLGQQLVLAAEASARSRCCKQLSLEVRVDNHAARTLYRKLGYAELSPLPAYYDDGTAGLRLLKNL